MSEGKSAKKDVQEVTPVERLVEIADAIFERAIKLDSIRLGKREDEAAETIAATRDDAFAGCAQVWRVALQLLPSSGLDRTRTRELEMDAYKVISRCHHRLGNLDGAKRNIARAIDAGYVDGFISLGAICLDLDDLDEAETAFRTAIKKDVLAQRAHAGLGELYFKKGTEALKTDPEHRDYFALAEAEFIAAGKARFTEGFDRAMDLFETMGWRGRAADIGNRAAQFYEEHRESYGEKLRNLNQRIRSLAGDERHERLVAGVSKGLGAVFGGKGDKRD